MKGSAASHRFGKFTLDTRDRRLSRDGREIYLRPKTYDTLLYLLERPRHLVTKEELLDAIWGDAEVTENALTRCVKEVRAALGDEVHNPRFIRTVPRLGYEFIAAVDCLSEAANGEAAGEPSRIARSGTSEEEPDGRALGPGAREGSTGNSPARASVPLRASGKMRATARWLAVAAAALIAAAVAFEFGDLRRHLHGWASSPRVESVAVLPLEYLTGDPQEEYLADGMTEELITHLGKVTALRVISHTSVKRYKDTKEPLPQIAKELNVDAVIEGSVSRDSDRVRITAQLIQGSTDQHLWGESYERDLRDVLALQDDVASAIAGEVRAEVAPGAQARLASRRPVAAP